MQHTTYRLALVGGLIAVFGVGTAFDGSPVEREDFYVTVVNESPFRAEIGISYSPARTRRIGRVPSNADRRLEASWRDNPFVIVITLQGAGAMSARGGANERDAIFYTDVLTAEPEAEVTVTIPARPPGPYLRTVRP